MKNLTLLLTISLLSLVFSSCCSMFGWSMQGAGYRTESRQVKTSSYDLETVPVEGSYGGKDGMLTVQKKVYRYKTVDKQVRIPCPKCTRYYCPKKDCCGTTSETTLRMASAQGWTGSPHIGLLPTMKPLAP